MDVCLYMRYSSDRQTEQSIEGQHRVCKQFCDAMGYNIVDIYVDRALSAFHDTGKRIDFQRMISDSDKHLWQAVVVYKLDRFARNRYDSATYKARLKKNGVRVISATENISDNPEGVLLESVLEGMAEFYSKELSQKITRGMYESALKCNSIGGHIPLGYKIENKKLVIDPASAKIVKEAFDLYASGKTVASICDSFNKKGYRTAKNAEFNKNSFKSMFKNERYIGIYSYKDFKQEGGVPAIVDKDTFDKVQHRLKQSNASPGGRGKAIVDYILSGKLFCGHCGKLMNGESGIGRNGRHHYYMCSGRKRGSGCTKKTHHKDALEYAVAANVRQFLTPKDIDYFANLVVMVNEEERNNNQIIKSLQVKVKDLDKSINNLLKLVEDGAVSHALSERLNELEKEKRAAEKRLVSEQSKEVIIEKEMVVFWFSKFKDGNLEDPEYRRHLIDCLVNTVIVTDNPDGTTTLDIGLNLKDHNRHKITLSDISEKGSAMFSKEPPRKNELLSTKTKLVLSSFSGGKNAIIGRNTGKKRLNRASERSKWLHRRSFFACKTGFG